MSPMTIHRVLSFRPGRLRRGPFVLAAAAAGVLALLLWLSRATDGPGTLVGRPLGLPGPVSRQRPAAPPGTVDNVTLRAVATPASEVGTPWGRRIVRQATVDVEADDVERAIARLTDLVDAAGGYVADTQVSSDASGIARATVTAYLPTTAFGRALGDLERLGRIGARRVTGQDVSEEFVDLEARIRNLERHEAQLLSFMGKAQKVADLITLESELARVRGESERLTGRVRFLRARSEMAGVQVSLVRTAAPRTTARWAPAWERLRKAFVAGWEAAFDLAVGLAAAAAQLSPLALPAVLGWLLYRRLRRQPATPPVAG